MKIKKKTLVTFLKKAKMSNSQSLNDGLLRFEKDGLKISGNSPDQRSRCVSWLKKESFVEYEELGNVGLSPFIKVITVIDAFDELISLKVEGNLLTVSGEGKKVEIELISEDFLNADTNEPKLEFKEKFTLSASKLKDIFKDVSSSNKDATVIFETQPKKLIVSNTGKYKFTYEMAVPSLIGGEKVQFAQPLIDAILEFTGDLQISLSTDMPCKIIEQTSDSTVYVLVAPKVDE